MKMEKLLPQANTLSVVVNVFLYVANADDEDITLEEIAGFIGYDTRQASYYLNACFYLGLIDCTAHLTEVGKQIAKSNHIQQGIYERVITDPLVNKFFARMLLFPLLTQDEIEEYAYRLTKSEYPDYSESVLLRRSSCLVGWCYEIKEAILKF